MVSVAQAILPTLRKMSCLVTAEEDSPELGAQAPLSSSLGQALWQLTHRTSVSLLVKWE